MGCLVLEMSVHDEWRRCRGFVIRGCGCLGYDEDEVEVEDDDDDDIDAPSSPSTGVLKPADNGPGVNIAQESPAKRPPVSSTASSPPDTPAPVRNAGCSDSGGGARPSGPLSCDGIVLSDTTRLSIGGVVLEAMVSGREVSHAPASCELCGKTVYPTLVLGSLGEADFERRDSGRCGVVWRVGRRVSRRGFGGFAGRWWIGVGGECGGGSLGMVGESGSGKLGVESVRQSPMEIVASSSVLLKW